MRKTNICLVLCLVGLLFSGCSMNSDKKNNEIAKKEIAKTNIPTLFLHGYSGNQHTMKTMMNQLEKENGATNEMTITITSSGELSVETGLVGEFQKNNPMINLVFENSKSDQWSQSEWIKTALTYLKKSHYVEELNMVGFSMGGISSFLYMENFSGEETQPLIKKLVTIGAPFNEFLESNTQTKTDLLKNGPEVISEQLSSYTDSIDQVPKETTFLLIGGQLTEQNISDGTVPLNSSLGIYSLLTRNNLKVKYQIITGNKGNHSGLRKNNQVINETGNFLWTE